MVAGIEVHGDKAAFVTTDGRPAWHRLGTVAQPGDNWDTMTALKAAHLTDWNVRLANMDATVEGGLTIPVPNRYAVVRDNPFVTGQVDVFDVVGSIYHPIQNEEHAELLNALTDQSNARIETAGSLFDGRKVFVCMKLPKTMMIGGEDAVDLYLIAYNSHDGSSKFEFLVSPIRVVCWNTLSAAISGAKHRFGVRHTKNAKNTIQKAREALDMTWKYLDGFEAEAEKMIQTTLTDDAFEQIVRAQFPEPEVDNKRGHTLWEEKFNALVSTYHNDETQQGIKGTNWGGYQAFTRYFDYVAPVAGQKSREDDGWVAQAQALRTATDTRFEEMKDAAFKALAVAG